MRKLISDLAPLHETLAINLTGTWMVRKLVKEENRYQTFEKDFSNSSFQGSTRASCKIRNSFRQYCETIVSSIRHSKPLITDQQAHDALVYWILAYSRNRYNIVSLPKSFKIIGTMTMEHLAPKHFI